MAKRNKLNTFTLLLILFAMVGAIWTVPGYIANAQPVANFTVNTLGDAGDDDAGDGECDTAEHGCTLRAALEESNALVGADVIHFALPPTSVIAATTDELLITDSVSILGTDAAQVRITSGFNFDRLFRIEAGSDATIHIEGITIGGSFIAEGNGAGILLIGSTLHLSNVVLQNNTAHSGQGGAIFMEGGRLYLTDSTVEENKAELTGGGISNNLGIIEIANTLFSLNTAHSGAGIYNTGMLTIVESHFVSNEAEGFGGAIYSDAPWLSIASSEFELNRSQGGGAVTHDAGQALISETTFSDNESSLNGGAILNYEQMTIVQSRIHNNRASDGGGIANSDILTVTQTLIDGNSSLSRGGGINNLPDSTLIVNQSTLQGNRSEADDDLLDMTGGGIRNHQGFVEITNSTLSGNFAEDQGGGLFNIGGTVQINNSTIAFNDVGDGIGGGAGIRSDSSGEIHVRNSIIARNGPDGDCSIADLNPNGIIAFNANLDSDGTCPLFLFSGEEPLLGLLQDNGGDIPTHLPDVLSPAVDGGSDDGCVAISNVDQRGFGRINIDGNSDPLDGNRCDLGAVERNGAAPTPTATMTPTPTATVEGTETSTPTPTTTPPIGSSESSTIYLPRVQDE